MMRRDLRSSRAARVPGSEFTDDEDVDHASKNDSISPPNEFEDSLQAMSDMYGHTPPRTRLNRKKRHMKHKLASGSDLKSEKEARPRTAIHRRNTLDTIIFNEMCDKADKDYEDETKEDVKEGRKSKRSLKLLRGNERDLKLDVEAAHNYAERYTGEIAVSTPNQIKVETRNRFRCLRSKPVDVEEKKVEREDSEQSVLINEECLRAQSPRTQSFREREIFHDTFSFLIKLGSTERNCRRQMSHEETRWQNELKDLIWLELQAHHADRSLIAQDEYLCRQREAVEGLLSEIMEYKYDPIAEREDAQEGSLSCVSPGDIASDRSTNSGSSSNIELGVCLGCLSMYCRACARAQGEALQQVEALLARLEVAEALYPSSHVFAVNYPLYKSPEFTDRVKAMCLWYNMTKHHRFKLQILGRLLMMLHSKKKQDDFNDSGISSRSSDTVDSAERQSMVRFELPQQDETSSPSDSNNSNNSSIGGLSFISQSLPPTPETSFSYFEDERVDRLDFYLVEFDRHAYSKIARTMIKQVNEFFVERTREIREIANFEEEDDELSSKLHQMNVGREWQGMFVESREKIVKSINLAKCLKRDIEKWPVCDQELEESLKLLKDIILDLRHRITMMIEDFQNEANKVEQLNTENDQLPLRSRIREILHQAYKMGFDFHKEMCKLFSLEEKAILARGLVSFALLWMEFVRTRCERGRGLRPRWANQGLEFLITVCEPQNTKHLTDQEFEELKMCMDRCISHVVGTVSVTGSTPETESLRRLSRSRASSPCHGRTRTASISISQKPRDALKSPELLINVKKNNSPNIIDGNLAVIINMPERGTQRHEIVIRAIRKVEDELDERLRSRELIGQVVDRKTVDKVHIKARRVTFTWQRGIKIGQGRFGKVYTVVNNQTGELLAMKEVQLQPGDHRAIRRVAEELQIFEGIQHQHLVRYYGLEIHREEMLIFMEFCAEGTLESLVAGSGNGLPESLVRKYTHQLLSAVAALHSHGIVHRDIKTANIFLTDEGNSLKLGDFGSAVQIKAHTTMPGELQGFVGTQAYMAPEVFMKSESSGHGRAVDIWSVGCCIIEMASGRRPWSDYDSNYQIMFKVGMGETPALPKNLSAEGIDLVKKCLQHDPKKRSTASNLFAHPFAHGEYEDVNDGDLTMSVRY
ncbi:PREDICTED: mitogen-activated protein kinase kinase kinase 4 [Acromyrmex echinatior]|uniref:Mitogen-activated protein kinase kinase kinase 4 n=1 Tax=Acromyrmex echinatior TaxID=103372 RepID=F4WB41_ACREC|nr:PREDICTED: mitogen-activated protein kinase kinase kinase 4 [Acromyrmex echinatior]EGI68596.1 Mitogen-activated protein kinase kinase kinase 4 [Acromyrmex echinatior]